MGPLFFAASSSFARDADGPRSHGPVPYNSLDTHACKVLPMLEGEGCIGDYEQDDGGRLQKCDNLEEQTLPWSCTGYVDCVPPSHGDSKGLNLVLA